MTLSQIRNPVLRRFLVVTTIIAAVVALLPFKLFEAIRASIRDGIGEELRTAWWGTPCP